MTELLKLGFALAPVGIILVASEFLWRTKRVKGERARKFIHILAGIWMAFWPFYIPFYAISMLGFIALIILLYSRKTRLLSSIYDVSRRTYGELLFALAIALCGLLASADWIFTTAILYLALADGTAAVVGRFWGIRNTYFVFGNKHLKKSVAGSVAFLLSAVVVMGIAWFIGGESVIREYTFACLVGIPIISLTLENTMPFGIDNIVTPVYVTIALNAALAAIAV
jgi:dolichol kinase